MKHKWFTLNLVFLISHKRLENKKFGFLNFCQIGKCVVSLSNDVYLFYVTPPLLTVDTQALYYKLTALPGVNSLAFTGLSCLSRLLIFHYQEILEHSVPLIFVQSLINLNIGWRGQTCCLLPWRATVCNVRAPFMFPFYGRGSHAQLSYLEVTEIIQISCSEPQTEFPISEEVESKVRIKLRGLNLGSWSDVSASYSAPTDLDSIMAHYPIWGTSWSLKSVKFVGAEDWDLD